MVEVTEERITLQSKGGGVTVSIEKTRRPTLEVGDRVRYDKKRNRLGKTVEKE